MSFVTPNFGLHGMGMIFGQNKSVTIFYLGNFRKTINIIVIHYRFTKYASEIVDKTLVDDKNIDNYFLLQRIKTNKSNNESINRHFI